MFKVSNRVLNTYARWQTAVSCALLIFMLSIGAATPAVAVTGYPLIDSLTGAFGDANDFMKAEITRLFNESGIEAAANQAKTTLDGLAEGAVPVIDDLANPYQENAQVAISQAMSKVQIATDILNKFAGESAIQMIEFLKNSPLFAGADFGITTPTGRIRIRVQGTEVSLCSTVVGPLGSVIVSGISNAEKLCNFPDARMANPTKSLIAFTYMAAGHTHVRTTQVLVPNLAEDLTLLPAPIDAATYVKTIGGQWVQIRLAGADPASVMLEAKFEVGLKGNVSYVVDVEAEGEAALKLSLKPIYAAEVIRSTGAVMLNKATALGLDMNIANQAANTAAILKAGLQHLSDIEPLYEEGFGDISIDVKLTAGIGAGVWDTGISVVSANSTFNLTYPLGKLITLRAGLLEEYLDIAMGMAEVNLKLGTSVLEGKPDFATFIDSSKQASSDFVNGVMQELLAASAVSGFTTESTLKLSIAGDADKESIALYESGLKLPVGDISQSLQDNPNAFGDAFSAITYLLQAAIDPDVVISDQTWADLETVIVPGIEFTLKVRDPVTLLMFGFSDADLLETIQTIASIRTILISVVNSSVNESLNDIRTAIENVVTTAISNADDAVIDWINHAKIENSTSFGTNGALGAEAVAELGASIGIEGHVSGSMFLLLLDLPIYQIPDDADNPEERGLLAKAAMPINMSLDAGASVGEGVELTVDAGGAVSLNLFELTAKHWEGDLPTAALMKVAGFSVLEFDGVINPDESLAGSGYLMLPMGGIVSADFAVDQLGNVTSGTWSGGLELGPLGNFPFIVGTLDNDGLHGTININLLGSGFNANFILNSAGLLLGSYDGAITIGGHELAAANIYLATDGQFRGHYEGDIEISGFTAVSNLDFDNSGFAGSSYMNVLGSELVANDIVITRSGTVSGTFSGDIVAGSHTLSAASLRVVNGGLIGTAMMDLPGVGTVEVDLRVFNGKVTAFYQGDLFNGLVSQASFEVTHTDVVMSANINISQFPDISSQVLDLVILAAPLAQQGLAEAEDALLAAQSALASAEQELNAASAQLTADLEAAQQTLLDKMTDVQTALQELNGVITQINALNAYYQGLISAAQNQVNSAQDSYNDANNLVNYYNQQISNLDAWYNNLSLYNKAKQLAYYTARRTQLLGYRAAAISARTAIQVTLSAAQLALNALNSELANLLNPLNTLKLALQLSYNTANDALTIARQALADIEASILADTVLSPLYDALDLARAGLTGAQELVNGLSGVIAMSEYFATQGADAAFTVHTANVTAGLSTLMNNSSFEIDARVTFMGQQGNMRLMFAPLDPVNSMYQAVSSLQKGTLILASNDVIAPTVVAEQPAEWIAEQTLIQLTASDNTNGSGVASITYSASGAQLISEVTMAGKDAFVLINTEGATTLSFYATDISGNVSEVTTLSINIDNSGPQVSVTPSGINLGVYGVVISAQDLLGSGIKYIAVSASGAEFFAESISHTDEIVISLTREGITTLNITVMDEAGNTTTMAYDVTVPRLIDENGMPVSDPVPVHTVDSNSSGGGSLTSLWMLLLTLTLSIRGMRTQQG
ncbi:MAG: hypothetical protein OEY29_11800 [Gammaproteobacteria bacterium]|nr:hypothetical protein [Gammaproteobacteria bacterium]